MEIDALAEASSIAWGQLGRAESDSRYVFPMRSMAGEIAAAVHESKGRTQTRMADAEELSKRFPTTVEALREGRITLRHADVIRRESGNLPEEVLGVFEEALLPVAEEVSPGVLRGFAVRVAEELNPRSFRERHEDALKRRTVWSEDLPDGLAELHVVGDAVKIHAVRDRLQRMARAYTRYVRAQERQREREQAAQQEHADREQREWEQTQHERGREQGQGEKAAPERADGEQAEREQGQAEREQAEREEPEREASEQAGSDEAQAEAFAPETEDDATSSDPSQPSGSSEGSEPSQSSGKPKGGDPGVDRWWLNVSEEDEKLFGELLEASCTGNGGRLRGTANQPDTRHGMGAGRSDGLNASGSMNGTRPPGPPVDRRLDEPPDGVPPEAWPDAWSDDDAGDADFVAVASVQEVEDWLRSIEDRILHAKPGDPWWPPDSPDTDPADIGPDDAGPADGDTVDVDLSIEELDALYASWCANVGLPDPDEGADFAPGSLARAVSEPADLERVAEYRQRAEAWADERTRTQVASDMALEMLLTGTVDAHSRMNGEDLALDAIQANIQVTVPATTLAGVSEDTGFLTGNGPVDPATARRLASEQPGWDRLFLHPDTGALETVARYTPTPAQKRYLRARDEVCRTPGCENLAVHADLDHTIPYSQGGRTHVSNLEALCPGCHKDKHHTPWAVRQIRPGVLEWTSPAGRRYVDHPLPQVRFNVVSNTSKAATRATEAAKAACEKAKAARENKRDDKTQAAANDKTQTAAGDKTQAAAGDEDTTPDGHPSNGSGTVRGDEHEDGS
ncbi:HNH endonuclease signature motif containing protein [Microbacterium oryzae]|nr:HNH endonuclease signature motif containing protein [Microbacterium oryzae]